MKKAFIFLGIINLVFIFFACEYITPQVEVSFSDNNLEIAIRELIGKEDESFAVFNNDVDDITSLDLVGKDIISLDGLEHFTSLEHLDLEDNFVDDVTPLAELEHLEWLNLRNNQITDLAEINFDLLKDLPLTHLSLRHNVVDISEDVRIRISDISVLANFTGLTFLELRDLQITDLSPIAGLTALTYLDISQNPFTDSTLSSISNMTKLTYLNVRETGATNLDVISNFTDLTYLNIHSNINLSSMSFIQNLVNLESLVAENVPVGSGVSYLSQLTNLMELSLQNAGVDDLTVIRDLMEAGALQDNVETAFVNILSNPLTSEDYQLLVPYWENVSERMPSILPTGDTAYPIINEFMTSNGTSIEDEIGNNEDWIELYNPSNVLIDLSGYYLSDDIDDLQKWQFPTNSSLPANGYLVLFASGRDIFANGELHTNFSLSRDGEAIFLVDKDGETIIDQVPSTEVPRDYSYGRISDGNSQWVYFDLLNATPGEANQNGEPYDETGSVVPVDFEYNIESFERLFNDTISKKITIEISQDEWDNLNQEMIDYENQYGNLRTNYYAKADFIYEDSNGEVSVMNIGFRTRGGAYSRDLLEEDGELNMNHFKVSFHESFDDDTLAANDIRTVFDVEELDMKWNRNFDTTRVSEMFALNLMNEFGVYAAQTTMAELYIVIGDESHYFGLYTIFEPIDNLFLEQRMEDEHADGDLYKSLWQHYGPASLWDNYPYDAIGIKDTDINYRPTYDIKTNKSDFDRANLESFMENISHLNGSEFDAYISTHFDVDRFLRYLAVNVLIGNPDDYRAMGNNYYLYNDPVDNIWTIIPYDFDHGTGQGWDGLGNYSLGLDMYDWREINGINSPMPLNSKILQIDRYQLQFEAYLTELMNPANNLFSYNAFLELYNAYKDLYPNVTFNLLRDQGNDSEVHLEVEYYMNTKIQEITSQIDYYQNNPSKRP